MKHPDFEVAMKELCGITNKFMAFAILNTSDIFATAYSRRFPKENKAQVKANMLRKLIAYNDRQRLYTLFTMYCLSPHTETPLAMTKEGVYGFTHYVTGLFTPLEDFPTDKELEALLN